MAALTQVGSLTIYRFPASALGLYAVPLAGGGPGTFRPLKVEEGLFGSGADAVLDGPMFQNCSSGGYPTTTCERPEYLLYDARSGLDIRGIHPTQGVTISVLQGKVIVRDGGAPVSGAPVAVQLFPTLVRNGSAMEMAHTASNDSVTGRAALVAISQTELAFVVGRDTLQGFANSLAEYGVTDAGYTDGGGSMAFATRDRYYGSSERRRVPVWLTAGAQPAGGSAFPLLGALVLGGGVLWWMSRARRR